MSSTEKAKAKEKSSASVTQEPIAKHPEAVEGMLAVGTEVNIKKSTLTGVVAGYHLSTDAKTLSYLVDYEDEGEKHQRGFTSNQIEKKEANNA